MFIEFDKKVEKGENTITKNQIKSLVKVKLVIDVVGLDI